MPVSQIVLRLILTVRIGVTCFIGLVTLVLNCESHVYGYSF